MTVRPLPLPSRPQRVMTVFGTRPEAIKMAPVIRALEADRRFESVVCVTAQHREMLDQVLECFGLGCDYDLDIMRPDQTPPQVLSEVITAVGRVLAVVRPRWLLVQGDTTTTMGAALAASYAGVRVGHVEADLRTGDRSQPFPEEINRRVVGSVADLHFAPTETARANLLAEGVDSAAALVTGNTVIDALFDEAVQHFEPRPPSPLAAIDPEHPVVLVTAHRRESFGDGIRAVCDALGMLAAELPDAEIVYPVHPNPNVAGPVRARLGRTRGITLLDPLGYRELVWLLRRADVVLTDSGGIQEEAPALGTPVLVLREVTERPEAVASGAARVVGCDPVRIVEETARLVRRAGGGLHQAASSPYGDGRSAARIVAALAGDPVEPFVASRPPAVAGDDA